MSEGQSKLRVVLAGLDRHVLVGRVNPVLCRTEQFEVTATATTPEELRQVAVEGYIHLVIVEANIVPDLAGAMVLLDELAKKARLVVVVPERWKKHRDKFSTLPNDVIFLTAPVDWNTATGSILHHLGLGRVVEAQESKKAAATDDDPGHEVKPTVQAQPVSERRPTETETIKDPSSPIEKIQLQGASPMVRIGFCGTRGGVGTSSAALAAARILAGENHRVALFDATKRGDLHVMAEIQPVEQPVRQGAITFFLGSPSEETVRDFDAVGCDAVVVDGGRTRGTFNAEWHIVSRPLTEEKIAQLVGVEPPKSEKEVGKDQDDSSREKAKEPKAKRSGGGFSLGDLISIEVT